MKNADYWRGRFAILENSAHKQADEYLQTLEDIYRETEHTVQRDIESWYQRFATNNNVTLAEARKMLTTGQLEEFKWTAEQYVKAAQQANLSPEWIKKLENASTRFHVSRLEAIQLQIQQQIELLYGNQVDGVDDLLKKLVSNGYTHGAFEIQKGIGLGWDFTALNQKKLETLLSKPWTTDGRTFRDRCWVNKADLVDTVNKELIQGMLRGDPPAKTITAIQKKFGTARYKARRLVHTETTYFNAVSKIQMYKDLGGVYIYMLEGMKNKFKDLFDIFLKYPYDGVMFHCSAGKDRTGITAALLLDLMGCHEYDIVKDYSESYENNIEINEELAKMMENEEAKQYLKSSPRYMMELLDYLREHYGSSKEYLLQIGLKNEEIEQLIENFTI